MVEGLAKVIPVPLLSLFTGEELRTMVCGHPDIPLDMLKSVAVYKGKILHCNCVTNKDILLFFNLLREG